MTEVKKWPIFPKFIGCGQNTPRLWVCPTCGLAEWLPITLNVFYCRGGNTHPNIRMVRATQKQNKEALERDKPIMEKWNSWNIWKK